MSHGRDGDYPHYGTTYPQNGNGMIGDIRERLATIEGAATHMNQHLTQTSSRVQTVSERVNEHVTSSNQRFHALEQADRHTTVKLTELVPIVAAWTQWQERKKLLRQGVQWALAMAAIYGALSGQITFRDAGSLTQIISKLFGGG